MPWQAHLYIGVPVRTYDEIRRVMAKLGVRAPAKDEDVFTECREAKRTVSVRGRAFKVRIGPLCEQDSGSVFPVDPDEEDSDAIVGFPLTARYRGEILDQGFTNGRPEPFVFDPMDCATILRQVRKWWPEAQLMIWDTFH